MTAVLISLSRLLTAPVFSPGHYDVGFRPLRACCTVTMCTNVLFLPGPCGVVNLKLLLRVLASLGSYVVACVGYPRYLDRTPTHRLMT